MTSSAETVIPPEDLTLSDFQPLAEFVQENPHIWSNVKSAYWAINNSKRNGLDDFGVIVKRSGKIHVVKPRAVRWMLAGQK